MNRRIVLLGPPFVAIFNLCVKGSPQSFFNFYLVGYLAFLVPYFYLKLGPSCFNLYSMRLSLSIGFAIIFLSECGQFPAVQEEAEAEAQMLNRFLSKDAYAHQMQRRFYPLYERYTSK